MKPDGNESGRDGETLDSRHGFGKKAMKADVTKELSTPAIALKRRKKANVMEEPSIPDDESGR